MIPQFQKTSGKARVNDVECVVWYDWAYRAVRINLTGKAYGRGGHPAFQATENGKMTLHDRKDGDPVPDFLQLTQPLLEDFPGVLESLYKALADFFGDSLDQPHPGAQHLEDMRKIVSKQLKVDLS